MHARSNFDQRVSGDDSSLRIANHSGWIDIQVPRHYVRPYKGFDIW